MPLFLSPLSDHTPSLGNPTFGLAIHEGPWSYKPPLNVPATVVLFLPREDRKILMVSRKNNHEVFGLPGGKIDPEDGPADDDSTARTAIKREVLEETGIRIINPVELFQAEEECWGKMLPSRVFYAGSWWGEGESREGAVTKWDDPAVILDGPFGHFNRKLFDHLKKTFPLLGWLP